TLFTLVWTFVITAILLILEGKMAKIQVFSDGILIDDFMYPAFIPNDAIKSIRLVYKMPGVGMRINGYGGLKTWKGFYRIKDIRRCILYVEDHNKGPFVEIKTTNDLFYINFKNAEQTQQLYDNMNSTLKLVDESRMIDLPKLSQKRSIVVVVVFVLVLMIPITLIPMLF
ncbi:MAG: hypothetical protein J5708_00260, partial [Bacteroidales bacterium]|nr:hypothetical protein [Bacteroidales bacterium]